MSICRPGPSQKLFARHIVLAVLALLAPWPAHATASGPAKPSSLQPVEPNRYSVHSKFWSPRIRHLVVNYIPYIMDLMEQDKSPWKVFARFKAVAARRAGLPAPEPLKHNWADNTVLNTFEAMCEAVTVDPGNDSEMLAAQAKIRAGIERWVPVLLGAQEPDGYLCTDVQLQGYPRFSSPGPDQHEGYIMGYFIEAAMAHYRATDGTDLRLYRAAKRTADLWCDTLGAPPRRAWQPDHEELELALARFSGLVNEIEGPRKGAKYLQLAKWLVDNRGVTPPHTDTFRQKDRPLASQAEPYGHAVMAGYLYAGAADIARLTGDARMSESVDRLWDGLVNRKMYLTGAMGSSQETFQDDFVLPNESAVGESCANIANLLFQHHMGLLHPDSQFSDVLELVLYNGVLGSVALNEPKWQYFNPLDEKYGLQQQSRQGRSPDCCMANVPRILLRLPTWTYAKSESSVYVNQFIGSTVTLHGIAGTDVKLVQQTDYPWAGRVSLTVNPVEVRTFAVHIRVPNRQPGALYTANPRGAAGLTAFRINGAAIPPRLDTGYAVVKRTWRKGDRLEFTLPMQIQRVRADPRVAADLGRVALQYGPLVYNFESVDLPGTNTLDDVALSAGAPLRAEWDANLLGGIVVIRGAYADGTALQAIPNYARMNRVRNASDWVHVASTYDGTTQRFYVNGRLARSRRPGPLQLANTPLTIGGDRFGQLRYFAGTIAKVAVFDKALDAEAVGRLAAAAPAITGLGVEARPVFAGGPYSFGGTNSVTLDHNIGITGQSPWTVSAWVRPADGCESPDQYGLGIVGWGIAADNAANFIYCRPEGEFVFGFFNNDARAGFGPKAAARSIVWVNEQPPARR